MSRSTVNTRDRPVDFLDSQPPAKRTRLQERKAEEKAAVVALARIQAGLVPVRLHFRRFLSESDVARLMGLSAAFTSAVLSGYVFVQHIFVAQCPPQLTRLVTIYKRYGLLITRMVLSHSFNASLVDSDGRSLLPSSLIALMLGYETAEHFEIGSPFFAMADWKAGASKKANSALQRRRASRLIKVPSGHAFPAIWGTFNTPLVPGCLPAGLRFLQLSSNFNQPLQSEGVFPRSLFFIQFGYMFDQPSVFNLPSTVTHLVVRWPSRIGPGHELEARYGCANPEAFLAHMPKRRVHFTGLQWSDSDSDFCSCCNYEEHDCAACGC